MYISIKNIIRSFIFHNAPVPLSEKLRSGFAGGTAIFLLAMVFKYLPDNYPIMMFGSMAASAVLLFAIPHSPLAQPWNLIVGHLISALTGWFCILLIHDPLIAAGMGVGIAIFLMHISNSLHPPGAATALTMVLGSEQFLSLGLKWVILDVTINAGICLILAMLINNFILGRQYPMRHVPQQPQKSPPNISFEQQDLERALLQMEGIIDVSQDDLIQIFELALGHANDRNELKTKQKNKWHG